MSLHDKIDFLVDFAVKVILFQPPVQYSVVLTRFAFPFSLQLFNAIFFLSIKLSTISDAGNSNKSALTHFASVTTFYAEVEILVFQYLVRVHRNHFYGVVPVEVREAIFF